jgi:hypothetical protein
MPSRSQTSTFIAFRRRAEARNAMRAISPVALGDELNIGWHLNVPSRRLFFELLLLLQTPKQHSCQTTKARQFSRMSFILLEIAMQAVAYCDAVGPDLSEAPENRPEGSPEMSDRARRQVPNARLEVGNRPARPK